MEKTDHEIPKIKPRFSINLAEKNERRTSFYGTAVDFYPDENDLVSNKSINQRIRDTTKSMFQNPLLLRPASRGTYDSQRP